MKKSDNPQLHLLYVKWGVQHLKAIDSCISTLSNFGNLNLLDAIDSLEKARLNLVHFNAAYKDADEILKSIQEVQT